MKIKNLLLLGLMTLLSMNAFAVDANYKVNGVWYHYDKDNIAAGATVLGISAGISESAVKDLVIPKEFTDGNSNTVKVVALAADWMNQSGTCPDLDTWKNATSAIKTLTINIDNLSSQFVDNSFYSLVEMTKLTLTGTSDLNADYLVPHFVTSTHKLVELDYSGLAAKSGKKLQLEIYANDEYCEKITVPATMEGVFFAGSTNTKLEVIGVKTVDSDAFSGSKVKSVTFAADATIGNYAFRNASNLSSVTFGGKATIGTQAFEGTSALQEIAFTGETTIGEAAFKNSGLVTAKVNLTNVTTIAANAFNGCAGITALTIPASVTAVADKAFAGMPNLESVSIDNNNLETIGKWFGKPADSDLSEKFSSLTVKSTSITSIGEYALEYSKLATIDLSQATALTTLANSSLASTQLEAFVVPATLTTIDQYALANNLKLASVDFGSATALTTIGQYAFKGDPLLTAIDLSGATSLASVETTSFDATTAFTSVKLEGTALDNDNFVKAQAWLAGSKGSLAEISLPAEITEIGGFADFTELTAITLPAKIATIKDGAFNGCSKLATVNIPATVTSIGASAFKSTALNAIDFSAATALATIGESAFASTKLAAVKIPATIKTLENSVFADNADLANVDFSEAALLEKITKKAFYGTALTTIDLDKCSKLTLVDDDAFPQNKYTSVKLNGTALAGLADPDDETSYYDNFSWPFNKNHIMAAAYNQEDALEMTLPAGLKKVEASQFKEWTALKEISLPKAVTEIGANAFEKSGLTGIKIRENVTKIDQKAFNECADLALVNLSEATALTEIGEAAFADCPKLTAIDFAGATKLATVGKLAFYGDGLTTVKVTGSIETIGEQAFYKNALESVDFTEAAALTTIGARAFGKNDGLTTLDLTGATALTTVAPDAFPQNEYTEVLLAGTALDDAAVNNAFSQTTILANSDESLTKITFPDDYDVATFNDYDYFKNLNSIILPANATEIPNYAFQGSNITSFEVGENITRIGKFAFQASALESIDFTKATALTEIDDAAFANTASLKSVGLPKNLEVIPASAFEGSALESVKIKSHVKKILTAAFKNCAKLATVNFEDANALEQIKDQAFLGTALTTIDLSGATKLTLVDYNAFPQNKYTSVKLNGTALAGRDADGNYYDYFSYPFSKANIMANAYNQDGVLEMTLPAGLEKVEASQFKEWTALKEISLPKAVTEIGASAFQASGLTGIKIRENVTKIDQEAFKGCKDLATVNMSEAAALTEIGMAAFADCYFKDADGNETGLASIAIPAAVTKIGTAAFSGCVLLAEADFSQAAALEEIGVNAFNEFGTSKATALTVIDLSACTKLATVYESSFPKNNYTKILLNGTALTDLAPVKVWMSNWETAAADDPTCKTTLKEITLPAQVTTIPSQFLADFTGVTEVSLPRECITIGSYAFAGSGLTGIKIRSKVQTIGSGAFVNCENLATANFAEATALTTIDNIAFKNTAVAEVVIPENADENDLFIGVAAFKDSKLKSFSAKSWAEGTVYDDETSSLVRGNYVSEELFLGTKLNGIAIPAVMKKIGGAAFADCKKLASVKFKHSKRAEVLEEIGDYAFRNCESLEALDLSNTKLEAIESYRPFEGCTALATITFPEELTSLNSDYLFADCPIENLEAPNLEVSGVLFGYYRQFDPEDPTIFWGYERRDKDNANTTLKTVKIAGYIPEECFLYCTALESVEWLGGEADPAMSGPTSPVVGPVPAPTTPYAYVEDWAFGYCTGLQTFTYEPENVIESLMVDDEAFIGCTPYLLFATNSNYLDYVATWHHGAAPINTTFGDVDITKVTTVQDKANASQFIAKYVNNGPQPVYIDANDAKVYSIYVDGDAAYFSACRTFDGKYVIQPQTTAYGPGFDSHVIVVTEEAKEVPIHRMFLNELYEGIYNKRSVAYDDCYDSQKDDDLAHVLHNAMTAGGATTGQYYLYRLTNTSGIGFGFTSFTGTNIKEGQFFVACSKKPDAAGRLTTVWLDEDGNVIRTDGEATGIESVESNGADNDAIFNMQGVRVEKAQKGIYIQNGKKIVVK